MDKLKKLEIVLKQEEDKNEKVFEQSDWCRKHKFEIQADVLYKEYKAVGNVLRSIRMKVVEEILDV